MPTEKLEQELRCIKWDDFDKLQTNKTVNINFDVENVLSNVEDTFINTAGKVLRKETKHKESEVKKRKSKNKK